jgi:hypothetical protein
VWAAFTRDVVPYLNLTANILTIALFVVYMKHHRLDRDTREAERALRVPRGERRQMRREQRQESEF